MRLGFACAWDARPEGTWSHVPWNLRTAMRERVAAGHPDGGGPVVDSGPAVGAVVDVGIAYPPAVRAALKAACARRAGGGWVSMWRHSRAARAYGERALRRGTRAGGCDAVLQVQDLARLDRPYFLVQDMSYDVLLDGAERTGGLTHFPTLSRTALLRLRDRQRRIYDGAAGVLAMSRWFADHLVAHSGVPAARVHVVHPGASAVAAVDAAVLRARLERPRRRLLFVGRDFRTKAGETVVRALAVLRREVDPAITLTVVGPREWPLPGDVPDGVRFLGLLPVERLPAVYAEHDLFVLPSRFEGFGIVFVEALARGLPCVGRRAFAMPEIITPGRNGDLLDADPGDGNGNGGGDDPGELARVVARLLADDAVYRATAEAAPDVTRHYSWNRAAADVLDVVSRETAR